MDAGGAAIGVGLLVEGLGAVLDWATGAGGGRTCPLAGAWGVGVGGTETGVGAGAAGGVCLTGVGLSFAINCCKSSGSSPAMACICSIISCIFLAFSALSITFGGALGD